MAMHVFGNILTGNGTAANNRGLTEGNITTLQKLVWNGQVHTTVSAEAIRFALRRRLAERETCNRTWDDDARGSTWRDPGFAAWTGKKDGEVYLDDDLLGFMSAKGAEQEGAKGEAKVRRSILEVTRAVSLTPWPGDVTFNAASPGATPSAQKKGSNPVPYGTEMHATRYQYGFSMTPAKLKRDAAQRATWALEGLCGLGEVAGNHGRFLFDFSPDSIILRTAEEAAPRILYSFGIEGSAIGIGDLLRKVRAEDVRADELVIGGAIVASLSEADRTTLRGAELHEGVRGAGEAAGKRMRQGLA